MGDLPESRAIFTIYPSHSLLSVEIGDRQNAGETESVAYGYFDIELTEDGRLCAIESALSLEHWEESPERVPTLPALASAMLLTASFQVKELNEPCQLVYYYDPVRRVMGVTVPSESRLYRVASGVLLELTGDDYIAGVWVEQLKLQRHSETP